MSFFNFRSAANAGDKCHFYPTCACTALVDICTMLSNVAFFDFSLLRQMPLSSYVRLHCSSINLCQSKVSIIFCSFLKKWGCCIKKLISNGKTLKL